ncbi:preprotein translocase subunit SecE [candidate division WOR-1 bacterium RIFOXYB2_FULL_48_7]|uniref:Protein translocase subunit SecE n=1 Tax=candidate division WOR-1 bacterium RIFOXYB2_FULL_48_7 TaxID=1802583 RepID=A0A1F4TKZ7_UNCSA|nr:MAG: preprotein translocase subunit SecE [candidate division WOR-1 bacterium RIFOXYB2_FULL_48_7]
MKGKLIGYIKETLAELKKVTWPDRSYVSVATVIVLLLVIASGLFVMLVDFGLAEIFKIILR